MMNSRSTILMLLVLLVASGAAPAQNRGEAEVLLADGARELKFAQIAGSDQMTWAPLETGVDLYSATDRYQWTRVPESLGGVRFLVLPHQSGFLEFKVASSGLAFFASSTRGFASGNSSGDWRDEALFERDLRRRGWRKIRSIGELSNNDTGVVEIYYRHCEAGEEHRIRTEKYSAPMLLIR